MSRRPKYDADYKALVAKFKAEAKAEIKAKHEAALAALTPEKIDAILHDLHAGGAEPGTTYGQLACKHGLTDVFLLVDISERYSDRVTMSIRHTSIAEAKAWRARRRQSRKAARALRSPLPAPTPEGSPS